MSDFAARQNEVQPQGDLEMSDVRLLDDDEEDLTMPFGQSNLTSVLANPDFGRRRCLSASIVTNYIYTLLYSVQCILPVIAGPGTVF